MMEKMESKESASSFSWRKDQGKAPQRGGWPAGITFCPAQVADSWAGAVTAQGDGILQKNGWEGIPSKWASVRGGNSLFLLLLQPTSYGLREPGTARALKEH